MASDRSAASEAGRASVLSLAGLRDRFFGGAAGDVFRGMATLALGSGAARVISIAATPILTRIYSPQDFGLMGVLTALVAMLSPAMTLRYTMALPLPRRDGTAMNLVALSTGLMTVMILGIGILLWACGPALLNMLSMHELAPWWWLIILGLTGTSAYEILSMWATRRRAYGAIAQTQFVQGVFGSVIKIGLGLLAFKPLGLLLGQIASQSSGIGSLTHKFAPEFHANLCFISLRRIGLVARRYRGFPIYRLPSQFLLAFSMQAPLMFASALYDLKVAGHLGLALNALTLPLALFANATGQAYYGEVAKIGSTNPHKIHAITVDTIKKMFFLAIAPVLTLSLLGPTIFSFAFGKEWTQAGEFARYLSIYLLFLFISRPVAHAMAILGMDSKYLYINIVRSGIIVGVFALCYALKFSEIEFIISYSLTISGHYLFVLIQVLHATKTNMSGMSKGA